MRAPEHRTPTRRHPGSRAPAWAAALLLVPVLFLATLPGCGGSASDTGAAGTQGELTVLTDAGLSGSVRLRPLAAGNPLEVVVHVR